MAIRLDALRSAALKGLAAGPRNLTEARTRGFKTAFLCHSHKDPELAKGLVNLLATSGWSVYIDWEDATMPDKPNRETASRIQQKIKELHYFLFLATANSTASRWCPWEIGFADGIKPINQILVVPTTDGVTTHGNEYLELYRHVDLVGQGSLEVREAGRAYGSVPLRSI